MSLQDPVSDMLTRIRNAQKATKVTSPQFFGPTPNSGFSWMIFQETS